MQDSTPAIHAVTPEMSAAALIGTSTNAVKQAENSIRSTLTLSE
jgi:hypothetical protein